jgi:hypothetical protein
MREGLKAISHAFGRGFSGKPDHAGVYGSVVTPNRCKSTNKRPKSRIVLLFAGLQILKISHLLL